MFTGCTTGFAIISLKVTLQSLMFLGMKTPLIYSQSHWVGSSSPSLGQCWDCVWTALQFRGLSLWAKGVVLCAYLGYHCTPVSTSSLYYVDTPLVYIEQCVLWGPHTVCSPAHIALGLFYIHTVCSPAHITLGSYRMWACSPNSVEYCIDDPSSLILNM